MCYTSPEIIYNERHDWECENRHRHYTPSLEYGDRFNLWGLRQLQNHPNPMKCASTRSQENAWLRSADEDFMGHWNDTIYVVCAHPRRCQMSGLIHENSSTYADFRSFGWKNGIPISCAPTRQQENFYLKYCKDKLIWNLSALKTSYRWCICASLLLWNIPIKQCRSSDHEDLCSFKIS